MEQLFDCAPILIKVDQLSHELSDGCMNKRYEGLEAKCNELIVQARMLRAWISEQNNPMD